MVNSFFFHTGLKPKEGEYTSRPWEWPINIRVCLCFQVQIKNSTVEHHNLAYHSME